MENNLRRFARAACLAVCCGSAFAQPVDRFQSLQYDAWPTPNAIRTQTGRPGSAYWQQKADYDIDVRLDEATQILQGEATIRYLNASPDTLDFVWFALDQNRLRGASNAERSRAVGGQALSAAEMERQRLYADYEGDLKIASLTDGQGRGLIWTLNDTFARVDLPKPLRNGETAVFKVRWSYKLVEGRRSGNSRTGFDCPKAGDPSSCIYSVAQWFPRLAAYSDYKGWHLNPFLGFGSFALEMGDYRVAITVPAGQVVAATGELSNPADVLSAEQRGRLEAARQGAATTMVVRAEEARAVRAVAPAGVRTWRFEAKNVRDFAWSSSRSYLWQAQRQTNVGRTPVMTMAFYPQEVSQTWGAVALKAVDHALATGESFLFRFPYSTMKAAYAPAAGGFEYPTLVFVASGQPSGAKGDTPAPTAGDLDGLAGVLFHEVGHSFFPIVVNSDEREWTWMDEGLNSFLQSHAQKTWRAGGEVRGDPATVGRAMKTSPHSPSMGRPDSLVNSRLDGYDRPAAALEVLRTTVLGPKLFGDAFRAYGERWMFKRPTAFDFFRTVQDVSGKDLDWFWRGWFYGDGHVDLALERVSVINPSPVIPPPESRATASQTVKSAERTLVHDDADLAAAYAAAAEPKRAPARAPSLAPDESYYRLDIHNVGGVLSPVILQLDKADGTSERVTLDAEVWRQNPQRISWLYRSTAPLLRVTIDPDGQTGDGDPSNNAFELSPGK